MNTAVKKKVDGKPIEKLLKNNSLLSSDSMTIKESLARLQMLRQAYMQSSNAGKSVLTLPSLKEK